MASCTTPVAQTSAIFHGSTHSTPRERHSASRISAAPPLLNSTMANGLAPPGPEARSIFSSTRISPPNAAPEMSPATGPIGSPPVHRDATMIPMPTAAIDIAIIVLPEIGRRKNAQASTAQKTGAVYWSRIPTAAVEAVIDAISSETTTVYRDALASIHFSGGSRPFPSGSSSAITAAAASDRQKANEIDGICTTLTTTPLKLH